MSLCLFPTLLNTEDFVNHVDQACDIAYRYIELIDRVGQASWHRWNLSVLVQSNSRHRHPIIFLIYIYVLERAVLLLDMGLSIV